MCCVLRSFSCTLRHIGPPFNVCDIEGAVGETQPEIGNGQHPHDKSGLSSSAATVLPLFSFLSPSTYYTPLMPLCSDEGMVLLHAWTFSYSQTQLPNTFPKTRPTLQTEKKQTKQKIDSTEREIQWLYYNFCIRTAIELPSFPSSVSYLTMA